MPPHATSPNTAEPSPSRLGAALPVLLTLAVLAALVWGLRPDRPHLQPAPLRPPEGDCPKLTADFTPTNFTELPGVELAALTPQQRNRLLLRLNLEPCPCGCNTSVAYCFVRHPRCRQCKELVGKMVAEEKSSP